MDDDFRLARMERRQETLISVINTLTDGVSVTNAMIAEMMEWLKKPPSSELPDLLKAILKELEELPERVARAVTDGALDTRG